MSQIQVGQIVKADGLIAQVQEPYRQDATRCPVCRAEENIACCEYGQDRQWLVETEYGVTTVSESQIEPIVAAA